MPVKVAAATPLTDKGLAAVKGCDNFAGVTFASAIFAVVTFASSILIVVTESLANLIAVIEPSAGTPDQPLLTPPPKEFPKAITTPTDTELKLKQFPQLPLGLSQQESIDRYVHQLITENLRRQWEQEQY